jgi:hypothetical protein
MDIKSVQINAPIARLHRVDGVCFSGVRNPFLDMHYASCLKHRDIKLSFLTHGRCHYALQHLLFPFRTSLCSHLSVHTLFFSVIKIKKKEESAHLLTWHLSKQGQEDKHRMAHAETALAMRTAVKQWIAEEEGDDDEDIPLNVLPSLKPVNDRKRKLEDTALTAGEAVDIALAASAYYVDKETANAGIADVVKAARSFALDMVAKSQELKSDAPTFNAKAIAGAFYNASSL